MGLLKTVFGGISKRIAIYNIRQRNNWIGFEMNNLIRKQGQLTESQKTEYLAKLEKLKNELKTIGG